MTSGTRTSSRCSSGPTSAIPCTSSTEISPFNHELPILIPNFGGQFLGWRPWHYERDRVTRKATSIIGGPERVGSRYPGVARRVLLSVRAAAAAPERPAEAGHALAGKFLSHGLRRRQAHAVGVGSGRRILPRVREVRRPGICSAVKRPRLSPSAVPRSGRRGWRGERECTRRGARRGSARRSHRPEPADPSA